MNLKCPCCKEPIDIDVTLLKKKPLRDQIKSSGLRISEDVMEKLNRFEQHNPTNEEAPLHLDYRAAGNCEYNPKVSVSLNGSDGQKLKVEAPSKLLLAMKLIQQYNISEDECKRLGLYD